jgi:hypothetical protein
MQTTIYENNSSTNTKLDKDYSNYFVGNANAFVLRTQALLRNQSFVEKTTSLAVKIFAAVDLVCGRAIENRLITQALSNFLDILDFNSTFQEFVFWLNPLSSSTIDWEEFNSSVVKNTKKMTGQEVIVEKLLVEKTFEDTLKSTVFTNETRLRKLFSENLQKKGVGVFSLDFATNLAKNVVIKKKDRTTIEYLKNAAGTVALMGSNILALDNWKVIQLSTTVSVGGKVQVISSVFKSSIKNIVRSAGIFGSLLTIGYGSYKIYQDNTADKAEKEKSFNVRIHQLTIIVASLDLMTMVIPVLFVVNPVVGIALGIIAKSAGILSILYKG